MRIDLAVMRDRRGGGPPGAGRADPGLADVDMATPHLERCVGWCEGFRSVAERYERVRSGAGGWRRDQGP
ncbi:putative uncharacterized protein [Streptomyces azureus]|uniref:Uncharacterized protein n=1 Tax=Streptomyces azureus TaxID=146537 RepID=A0A0K8PRN1_STRAJ|nr:putative uncharacterized protein [Streptomyces azureus]